MPEAPFPPDDGPAQPEDDGFGPDERRMAAFAGLALTAIVLTVGLLLSRAAAHHMVSDCTLTQPGACADIAAR